MFNINGRIRVPRLQPIGSVCKLYPPTHDDAKSLVALGKYDFVDEGISTVELSWDERDEILVDLVGFDGTYTTGELLSGLTNSGIPAPLGVHLLFGATYPAAQTGIHIGDSGNRGMLINWYDPRSATTRLTNATQVTRKIVCLGTRIPCCVQNYDLAAALTHDDTFTDGRGLVSLSFDRNWSGEEYCFLRVLP